MLRDVHADLAGLLPEIDKDKQRIAACLAQKSIDVLTVETGALRIHQVVELSLADGFLALGKVHYLPVLLLEGLLGIGQLAAMIESAADGIHTPIVENSGAAVLARESLFVHATLAKLLPCIEHERVLLQPCAHHQSGDSAAGITGKEIRGQTLFVVVLEEVEHVLADVVGGLPFVGDGRCRTVAANHVAQTVVHAHLVVEQVEAHAQIVAVLVRIIDLADELYVGIAELHLVGGPCPEGGGHHLGHVAAEGIHALLCPEEQYVGHLVPSVGNGIVVL